MINEALFSSKDRSKKSKCRLLQFLFGALRVKGTTPGTEYVRVYNDTRFTNFATALRKKEVSSAMVSLISLYDPSDRVIRARSSI